MDSFHFFGLIFSTQLVIDFLFEHSYMIIIEKYIIQIIEED